MTRTWWAALAVLALILGACGNGDESSVGAADEQFDDADVSFAQQMIVHHEQAIEMSELAEDRAGNDSVRDLAQRIRDAQGPEIEQMESLLEDWGADRGHGGMDHSGMGSSMEGMMSDEQMAELEASSGTEFDRLFLEHMIEHHEGAITMAERQLAEGVNPEARDLAEQIRDDQVDEIAEMRELLEGLGA
jgi:uncharacterized protein (DUF305 family)